MAYRVKEIGTKRKSHRVLKNHTVDFHHQNHDLDYFHHPKRSLYPFAVNPLPPALPFRLLAITDVLSIAIVLPFLEIYIMESQSTVPSSARLLSLSIMLLRLVHVCVSLVYSFYPD